MSPEGMRPTPSTCSPPATRPASTTPCDAPAASAKVPLSQTTVTARVGIGPDDSGAFQLSVELHARLLEVDEGAAREIVEAAHRICPYSNAVRGNVDVALVVDPEPDVI